MENDEWIQEFVDSASEIDEEDLRDMDEENQVIDQAIEPEEDFVIDAIDETGALFGSFQGQNPGSFGDPAMDCNCRCTIKPVVIRR